MNEIWCNGHWLPANKYPGVAQDRGAFLGLGLFETVSAMDGQPLFVERHLRRVIASCVRLGWEFSLPDLQQIIVELLTRNGLTQGRARVRLIVTAGSGPHDDVAAGADRIVWLAAFPAAEVPAQMTLCLAPWPRNERSPLAGLKSACYAENLIALDHARRHGFQETVFLNTQGQVCETATANLFLILDGIICTPSLASGCLPGIGREVIAELAQRNGIPFAEETLVPRDLESAESMFLASAIRGPVAVSRFESRILPVLPVMAELRQLWAEEIRIR
jgi:branched-chain amino acid aminotransferase